jgi:hypothetical protein
METLGIIREHNIDPGPRAQLRGALLGDEMLALLAQARRGTATASGAGRRACNGEQQLAEREDRLEVAMTGW